MILHLIAFELYYRSKRSATYIYFGILFLLAYLGTAFEMVNIGGPGGQVKLNAPTSIASVMVLLTAIPGFFISSAIMGVPVLRDYQYRMNEMIFAGPINKVNYVLGRFVGSLLILIGIFSGMLWGLMLGVQMPWLDPDNHLPFTFYHYLHPFVILVLPNIFFTGVLFFWGGVRNKSIIWVFFQGVMLLALYFITNSFVNTWENKEWAAVLDPVGINLLNTVSRYWTISELNTQLYGFSGLILANRFCWMVISILLLLATVYRFQSSTPKQNGWRFRRKKTYSSDLSDQTISIKELPTYTIFGGSRAAIYRLGSLSWVYFKEVVISVPFVAITVVGVVNIILNSQSFNQVYGITLYPTTQLISELIANFSLYLIIITIFYTGELIWRERDIQFNEIMDTLPLSDNVKLLSKFLGMVWILILLHGVLLLVGICIQTFWGYFDYNIPLYLNFLFVKDLSDYILFTVLIFCVHVWANHKFLGHTYAILLVVLNIVLSEIGVEHGLFQYASGKFGTYSDMNGFGVPSNVFWSYRLYWTGAAICLMGLAIAGFRGREIDELQRWSRLRAITKGLSLRLLILGGILMLGMGLYIGYNTIWINTPQTTSYIEQQSAQYEKTLGRFRHLKQPTPKAVTLAIDLYPKSRDFNARGNYMLVNDTPVFLEEIHVQLPFNLHLNLDTLNFSRTATLLKAYPSLGFYRYKLDHRMAPGDSMEMYFKLDYLTKGFVEGEIDYSVVENGSFLRSDLFPQMGYDAKLELKDRKKRQKYELDPQRRVIPDSLRERYSILGDYKDFIQLSTIISTERDQLALAPGNKVSVWVEDGRNYFQFQTDTPIINYYGIVSATYAVQDEIIVFSDSQRADPTISLEVYYHPEHKYNVGRLLKGMRETLIYSSINFSPYPYSQLRIMEFPQYRKYAQSFAQTIPFSEGLGFMMDIEAHDIDMAFYIASHEVAHQWWGNQVVEADVAGKEMLSETLAQYVALMVMKDEYGEAMMQNFLKYELDAYLKGRAYEKVKELPLAMVGGQDYIHYNKGALAMYAFQDYISEDSVNKALKAYCNDWRFRSDRYPTSKVLLSYFREVTPDTLQYIIKDLFETITLYENRVREPTYIQKGQNRYEVTIPVDAQKYRADSLGKETPIPIDDWIDIGVIGKTSAKEDTLLYLQKHRINKQNKRFTVYVSELPVQAGIDPINKLIDRNPEDNLARVIEKIP